MTYRNPPPPFTTSTLQQESSTKLGMASNVTMQIAQQLYEGLDLTGLGHIALVTYIRTDSTRVSAEATAKARETLAEKYGEKICSAKTEHIQKSQKQSGRARGHTSDKFGAYSRKYQRQAAKKPIPSLQAYL